MAVIAQDKILVACPRCGHTQPEPRTGFSTLCRKCGGHFHVQEASRPKPKTPEPGPAARVEGKHVTCFQCGTELVAPPSAQSTMCKRCSAYLDLKDYVITSAVSKNFRTRGSFTLETTGYVFNTEAFVGDAILKGRFLGKLVAERSLTIHSTAEIRGTFSAGRLVIPAGNRFTWKEAIVARAGEISGELVANLRIEGTLVLKSTARMFGDVTAGSLVVEEGAVVEGRMRIGKG